MTSRRLWQLGVWYMCMASVVGVAAESDEPSALVQDFEQAFEINKWPTDHAGEIAFSRDWKADGAQSLRIDAGLVAALEVLKLTDWRGYTVLRLHLYNPSDTAVPIGFELQDQHKSFPNRHQNAFGVAAGESVIDMDISGGLWRGEENRPYLGSIKTPIDIGRITRLTLGNQGMGPVHLDKIEVVQVRKLETPGGFAFDFGRAGTQVMGQFAGVFHNMAYDVERGYGMIGGLASTVGNSMSFPTPLLGDGVAFEGGFRVDLPQGAYRGWIAFERGGFWEGEYCAYRRAVLNNNGKAIDQHEFGSDGAHFRFQDLEITSLTQLADTLIWPAHEVRTFLFDAAHGGNTFTIKEEGRSGYPLRVAGLVLAPDTPAGRSFIAAHEALQKKVVGRTYAASDKGRRGRGRTAPARDLVCEPVPAGQTMYPRDWPTRAAGSAPAPCFAVRGQTLALHLGLYARKDMALTVTGSALGGPGRISAPVISHGRYLPQRIYGVGSTWLEINHYRPDPSFDVGPEVSRALLAEYVIPDDAEAGTYTGAIRIRGAGGVTLDLPVRLTVAAVSLPEIPVCIGLFHNALTFDTSTVDEATWWRLQESVLAEQGRAGLNTVSGGLGLTYHVDKAGNVSGAAAVRYLQMAAKHGLNKAVVPYGGFFGRLTTLNGTPGFRTDFVALRRNLAEFEREHGLPPTFLNAFDEPRTEEMQRNTASVIAPATKAGLRTIGWTSAHWSSPAWVKLIEATYAPALAGHDVATIAKLKSMGKHPWIYGGISRYAFGLQLWRQIKMGVEGRMGWIGFMTQGFAFHNLDGREPSWPCFLVHKEYGALKTPLWLAAREGLLDLRLRLALERVASADDPAMVLWFADGYLTDHGAWPDAKLDEARAAMIKRLAAGR